MGHILVIEDDPQLAVLLVDVLALAGHQARHSDGPDALTQIAASRPDLVVLDLMLQGTLDGVGLARALRADPATTTLPIVVSSAAPGAGRRAEDVDADAVIYKPFSIHLLQETVAKVLARGRHVPRAGPEPPVPDLETFV